jgi:HEAT repeat protein
MSFHVRVLAFLLLLNQGSAAKTQPTKAIPPGERRDILGRPIPRGKEVAGQRVCLRMSSTRLLYGQPIDVHLITAQATEQAPYIRLDWEGPRRSVFLEWVTDGGDLVTFHRWDGGQGSGLDGNHAAFRLQPTGKFARGQYLIPGKYRIRAVIDSKRVPADPVRWVGHAQSNTIEFVVFESDERGRLQFIPEAIQEKAAVLVPMLDDPDFEKRERAERELLKLGFEVLPLIEGSLEAASAEARLRSRRILSKLTAPLFESRRQIGFFPMNDTAALLAPLGEASWRALAGEAPAEYAQHLRTLRVEAALRDPVRLIAEGEPLPAETVRRLVADLTSEEAHVRAAAVRTVPRTTNPELPRALVARVADPYKDYSFGGGDPVPIWPIADHVGWHVIPWHGKAIIDPLLAFARKEKDSWIRRRIFLALGMIGPDPRSLPYVRESIAARDPEDSYNAVNTLAKLGPETLPDLIKLIEAGKQEGQNPNIPCIAVEHLAHHGTAESVGPVLMRLLRHPDWQISYAAIPVVEKISLREALPELKRLAQEDYGSEGMRRIEQNLTGAALCAYARMADRKDAAGFLLNRLGSRNSATRGLAAFMLAAIEWREAAPRILDLLSDKDWYVRAQADQALRGLAQRPDGVGYDAYRPDPSLWRNWWTGKQ